MQRKLPVFIFLFALVASASAQHAANKKNNAPAAASSYRLDNTLLWEISGKDLSSPSWLFGTMHLLCAEDAQLSDSLRYSIGTARQVYFEIDMDNLMETLGALKYLNMNNNTRLSDLLSPAEYQRVKDYFKNNKVLLPLSMLERMKPYFTTALISESKFPCPAKDGMEQVIMKEAKKDSKPILGLETVQFQASVFDSIPYQRQAKDLVKMIDSSGNASDSSDLQLMEVYRKQDLNKMQEMTANEEGMGDFIDLLLYNRNANWVRKMPDIMRDKSTLFAVGAGHLGGEKGVISLLRKAGYTVRPVTHKPGLETITN
ncbi:MAG TPA: TraB/GumN family protein [Chitinophagaceae bacterium]|nr:TraB/GumN family protein [Chitinophagaceae bacterium]